MEKLGYGWQALKEQVPPRLIYAAVSGFGHTGPYRSRPAYDMVVQGMGGIRSLTGHPGGPPTPGRHLGRRHHRRAVHAVGSLRPVPPARETGRGTMLDVAMLDCRSRSWRTRSPAIRDRPPSPADGGAPPVDHPVRGLWPPPTATSSSPAGNDGLFARLATALGNPDLGRDPRFATNEARTANVLDLKAEVEAILATRTTADWLEAIGAAGVPCGPINDVAQALADPQIQARTMVIEALGGSGNPDGAPMRMAGNPIKLADVPDPATRTAAPDLDADRRRSLAALGLD